MKERLKIVFGVFLLFILAALTIISAFVLICTFPLWIAIWILSGFNVTLYLNDKIDTCYTLIHKMIQ